MLKRTFTLIIMLVLAISNQVMAAGQTKDIMVQQTFNAIRNPTPSQDFKISVWVDNQSNTYNIGESITFFFRSTRDCYIHLLDIGTSGTVTMIYPNRFDQNNFIKAGVTYQLPRPNSFKFTAAGPAGTEMVKAIGTLAQTNLFNLTGAQAAGPFKTFDQTKGTQVAKDIQVSLNQVPAPQWAEYAKVIKIVQPTGPMPITSFGGIKPAQGYQAFGTTFWTDKQSYRIGEPIRFYFSTNKKAHVTLISIGTSGQVKILFPNRFTSNNLCDAGVTYSVPAPNTAEQYVAKGPAGTETLKLIATESQFNLLQAPYDYSGSPYPLINKSVDQVSKDIQVLPANQAVGTYHDEAELRIQITH